MDPTETQWNRLLDAVGLDEELLGEYNGPGAVGRVTDKWERIAAAVNDLGGSFKTGEKWRDAFLNLRNRAKRQYNDRARYYRGTGGGPPMPAALGMSPVYCRVMRFVPAQQLYGHAVHDPLHVNQQGQAAPAANPVLQHVGAPAANPVMQHVGAPAANPVVQHVAPPAYPFRGQAAAAPPLRQPQPAARLVQPFYMPRPVPLLRPGNAVVQRVELEMDDLDIDGAFSSDCNNTEAASMSGATAAPPSHLSTRYGDLVEAIQILTATISSLQFGELNATMENLCASLMALMSARRDDD